MKYTKRCMNDFNVQGQSGPACPGPPRPRRTPPGAVATLKPPFPYPLYVMYGESLMQYTGWLESDLGSIACFFCIKSLMKYAGAHEALRRTIEISGARD